MKKDRLIKIINNHFNDSGTENIINQYYIDHKLNVKLSDIKISKNGHISFFMETDPEELYHTIEDEDGESVTLWEAVHNELEEVLTILGIDIIKYDIRMYLNKTPSGKDINNFPFIEEQLSENVKLRLFSEQVDSSELKWHYDNEDRIVIPQHNTDWYLQMDNELPVRLIEGNQYFIPKDVYHRVIKGSGDLKVRIIFR